MLPRDHYLKQAFSDPVHFPNGFEKGGLSDIQARLVRKNGTLINALCIDEVSDPTSDDLHMLKVIANQSAPKNPVEQAWMKYLSQVKSLTAASAKPKTKAKPKAEPTPIPAVVEKAAEPAKNAKPAKEKVVKEPAPKASSKKAAEEKPNTKEKSAAKAKPVEKPKATEKATSAKVSAGKNKAEPTAKPKKSTSKA